MTQFRVPVMEEYIDAFSISELLHEGEKKSLNNAHINIGKNILACITIEGKPLKLKGGRFSDITPLLFNIGTDIPEMGVLEELSRKENISAEKDHANYPNHILTILSKQITHVISVFCTLFPLDTIFLSGNVTKSNKFIRDVREFTRLKMAPAPSPAIQVLDTFQQPVTELLAKKIRNKVLSAIGI